ncbi:hypothetical protein PENSPDRAFT_751751 [Peniophora sp. CONT]|nr:hypothetical protein PENSPDRAFT_751751 [Peniophora sp. CONT]
MSISETHIAVLLHQLNSLRNSGALFSGLWFHELITHLHYDWRLFRRSDAERPMLARLTKWIYLACRTLSLIHCFCVSVLIYPGQSTQDCHIMIKVITASGIFGIVCATILLSIRVAAIWIWDRRIVGLLVVITLVTLALCVYLLVKVDFSYDPRVSSCVLSGMYGALPPSMAMLVGDCTILSLLFMGLQIKWRDTRQFRTWHGLIYLLLAAAVEVPFVTLLFLDLNPTMDAMFVTPTVVTLAICATRIFRSLNTAGRGDQEDPEMFISAISLGRVSTFQAAPNDFQLAPLPNGGRPRE